MGLKRGYYDVFVRTCAKSPSRVAVRLYENGVYKKYTYSELYGVCEYISQNIQQLKCTKGVIGLISERNIIIPCVIAAAHKCCTTFMFIDPTQDIESLTADMKFKIIITINNTESTTHSELFGKKPDKTVKVFDLILDFFNLEPSHDNIKHVPVHSFIAQTSGSTGNPKNIQVPIQCIQPNIDDLTKMFNITPDDIIFFSTPLTFDPSLIEILLACMNGASLLIAPDKADILFPSNRHNSITFWQTTPSKFFQYSNADIKNKILSCNSTLKILALGGEPLNGVRRLIESKDQENQTRIFTLYGVTEMSCWACVAELDLDKITSDREVPLGNCLSETEVVVESSTKDKNTGKIILVSKTRQCIILNNPKSKMEENSLKFVDTGDIAEVRNGTIYYRGRKDDIVKRFGHKVNLQMIESIIMLCPRVKTCSCVWLPKPMLLVVYFSSQTLSSRELSDFLKCKLDDKLWPDKIIRVDNLPTNTHGKISRLILSKMFESVPFTRQTFSSLRDSFVKELKATLSMNFIYDNIKDRDFFSLGGTSFLAVSLCNKLALVCPQFSKSILPYLLTTRNTIDQILELAHKEVCAGETKPKKRIKRTRSSKDSLVRKKSNVSASNPVQFIVLWTYDTGKCVDASPTLYLSGFKLYVAVGSHSGKIIVADAVTGSLYGEITVGARIEASVLYYSRETVATVGVVGAYDGTVVCFTIESCAELWRINVGAMIKSKGVCCNGHLYIASYDGQIRCIDIMTGRISQTIAIADQAISADLVLAKNQFVLTGTLSGVCACVHTETGGVSWRGTLGGPVFASPVLYDGDKYVVFAEVGGEIHCRTVEKGIKIWKYQGARGNIFSSLYIKELDKLKWQMVFGCHDAKVYCITVKNFLPSLQWKTQMSSAVYCTPCGLGDKLVLAASNDGKLCVLDSDNGIIIAEHALPNETFSTPVVHSDYVFIGCRNDHLYCLKYVLDL